MDHRTLGAVVFGAALMLSACSGSSPDVPTASAGATSEATSAPSPDSDGAASDSDQAGAYLDYADGAIEATPGPKALFFHAGWCPQCRELDEELRTDGPPDGLTVFKVDYDARTDLRQKYGVTLQTTVVFVDDRGELLSSTVLYDDPSVASLRAAIP
ncbi:hypothetical protein ACFPER_04875 [Agromyces aurantiacus]|uniref:Thioredoxin domain-containing protein n=1 Tax=Agromyces aurantiacus TaxID=165814 RepID=A0ABV9R2Q8_9MICO|nr:thioredoxin family protein [Agromyces aurantiacus]MBM7502791.1 thiol-disulfide isomerase/thioredoxin [Agromyces aurantiacus]